MNKKSKETKETIVISLGGSLIIPNQIDWQFLKKFKEIIISEIKKGKQFAIVTGGGYTAREYIQAARKITKVTLDDQDWIGIHATRINAHLIKTIFRKYAHSKINKNPRVKEDLNNYFARREGIMIAAGWRPGWSSDLVATIIAERLKAKKLINLSNIEYVYNKDPKKFSDAEIIKKIDWKNFRKIVGNKWSPGLNAPFDPIASQLAEKNELEVIITNGKNLKNLKNIFSNKNFQGTIIKD